MKHDLLTIPEHRIPFSSGFTGVRVAQSIVFCIMFCRSLFILLFIFHLTSVLSVLRFTASDYHFNSFKLVMTSYKGFTHVSKMPKSFIKYLIGIFVRGGSRGDAPGARPLKLEKILFFGVKS